MSDIVSDSVVVEMEIDEEKTISNIVATNIICAYSIVRFFLYCTF